MKHKGRKIEEIGDDFNKDSISSDGEYMDKDMEKGIMTREMVRDLNFGGGDNSEDEGGDAQPMKSREERLAEIMEKSKAFKYHNQEIKEATVIATRELDEEWADVAGLLNFGKKPDPLPQNKDGKADLFDDLLT